MPYIGDPIGTNLGYLIGSTPELRFRDTAQADPAGSFSLQDTTDTFVLRRAATANWATFTTFFTFTNTGAVTFNGPTFTLSASLPEHRIIDTDQVAPAGRFRFLVSNNILTIQKSLTGTFTTVFDAIRIGGATVPAITIRGAVTFGVSSTDTGDVRFAFGSTVQLAANSGTVSFQALNTASTATTVAQLASATDPSGADFPSWQFLNRPLFLADVDLVYSGPTAARLVRMTDASGTNVAGQGLTIRPQLATGNAATGTFIVQTAPAGASGTVVQTAATAFSISPTTMVVNLSGTAQLSWTDGAFALQKATTISTTAGALTLAPVSGSNLAFTVAGAANIAFTLGTGTVTGITVGTGWSFNGQTIAGTATFSASTLTLTGLVLAFTGGGTYTFGTTDANALVLTTNNIARWTWAAGSANVQIGSATTISTAAGAITLAPVSGSNVNLTVAGAGSIALTFGTGTITGAIFSTFTMADVANIVLNATTGTIIGTAITQKLGFYNTTPIAQRAGAAQAAVATTASTQTTPWGYTTQAQADAIVTLVNELRAWAVAQGFIKGAA